jgi:hypothetical protein
MIRLTNVRFAPHYGLNSDIEPGPKSAMSGNQIAAGLLDQIAAFAGRTRRVTPEVLLCGGPRYKTEAAMAPVQKCENRVRV